MKVAAYGNKCPFLDSPDRVEQADMWMTALSKGAMTIRFVERSLSRSCMKLNRGQNFLRYEDFHFNMPFYVSIVVLESDDDCHLPEDHQGNEIEFSGNVTSGLSHRRKTVTVSIIKRNVLIFLAPLRQTCLSKRFQDKW